MKKLVFGFLFLMLMASVSAANMIIKSVPEKTTWIADGVTEYRMDVIADSTQIPDVKINSAATWKVIPPSGFIVTRAELPSQNNPSDNVNDYFYNYFMDPGYNKVSTNLIDNVRGIDSPNDGVSNRAGLLGSYWFIVSQNATLGNRSFGLTVVAFYDINYNGYKLSSHNLEIQNIPFVVKAPQKPGDMNNDNKINILDLIYVRNRMNTGDMTADANSDGKVNILDLIYIRNRLGNSC